MKRFRSPLNWIGDVVVALAVCLVTIIVLTAASCPQAKKVGIDAAACTLGQLPAQVAADVPIAEAALAGSPDAWAKEKAVLITGGADLAICVIKAMINDLTVNGASADLRARVGRTLEPGDYQRMLDRANVALAELQATAPQRSR